MGNLPHKYNKSICSIEYKIRKRNIHRTSGPICTSYSHKVLLIPANSTFIASTRSLQSTDLFIPAFRRWIGRFPRRCGNVAHPHASGCIDGVSVVGDRGKNRSRARARVTPRLYRIESYKHLHSPGDTRLKCGGLFSYSLTLPTKLLSPDHSCTQVLKIEQK